MNTSLRLSIRKDIDSTLCWTIIKQHTVEKTKLWINEDTCYDIFYDVYDGKYFYIKMEENTAFAPFIYNRSYELEELQKLNKIFKSCCTIEKVKEHIKSLFNQKKIRLRFEEDGEIIRMEMDVVFFCTPLVISFDLYREMTPPEDKDKHLLDLYNLNKLKLKQLKELYSFIQKNDIKNDEKIKSLFKNIEIPGIEV